MISRDYALPKQAFTVLDQLTAKGGTAFVYGGFLSDAVCLGHNQVSGDIDAIMSIADFLALKDPDNDIRRMFLLHEPHLLFMLHQMQDNVFQKNQRPIVLRLKPEYQESWGLSLPLGLTLTRETPTFRKILANNDLGFRAICADQNSCWVTSQFERDLKSRTMTMTRCRDALDYVRTLRRIERFQAGAYTGWRSAIPLRFASYALEATAI